MKKIIATNSEYYSVPNGSIMTVVLDHKDGDVGAKLGGGDDFAWFMQRGTYEPYGQTLSQLDVKPGDVVRLVKAGDDRFCYPCKTGGDYTIGPNGSWFGVAPEFIHELTGLFTVVSRATTTPTMNLPNGDTLTEGDYATLRNGDVVGPLKYNHKTTTPYCWDVGDECYTAAGEFHLIGTNELDIIARATNPDTTQLEPEYRNGNWHGWTGGNNPVADDDVVRYIDSADQDNVWTGFAGSLDWDKDDYGNHICAFCVVRPTTKYQVRWRDGMVNRTYDNLEDAQEKASQYDPACIVVKVTEEWL